MRLSSLSFVVLAVAGCAQPGGSPGVVLELTPVQVRVTVVDGQPTVQPFTATLTLSDGTQKDVTREVTFTVGKADFGTWDGSALTLTGAAVGETNVTAQLGTAAASAHLVVYASTSYFDLGITRAARSVFADALEDPTCGPSIAYPNADAVVPRNIGAFDVAWTDARDDLFEVRLVTTYRDVRVYTRGADPDVPFSSVIPAADWQRIASEPGPMDLRISGVVESAATTACTVTQHVRVSDQPLIGAVYVWTPEDGVVRHDLSALDDVMLPLNASVPILVPVIGQQFDDPMSCAGCAFSHSGTRLALPTDVLGYGWIYDFVEHVRIAPGNFTQEAIAWQSAAFTADDTRLLIEQAGQLRLVTDHGQALATMPQEGGTQSHQPAFSPDGTRLANVEERIGDVATTLVLRRFDTDTSTFGDSTVLVPAQTGVMNAAPAWSPDGRWLAFTRITGWGTLDARAALWVVKADGSEMPVRLTEPTEQLDIAAHWSPFQDSVDGEPFFYVSYASMSPVDLYSNALHQVLLQPFFPATETTASPIRLPFQTRWSSFQIAGWTPTMVN